MSDTNYQIQALDTLAALLAERDALVDAQQYEGPSKLAQLHGIGCQSCKPMPEVVDSSTGPSPPPRTPEETTMDDFDQLPVSPGSMPINPYHRDEDE